MNLLEKVKNEAEAQELQADWTEDGPLCTTSICAQHDGKRCQALGARPGRHCEPAIKILIRHAALVALTCLLVACELPRVDAPTNTVGLIERDTL